MVIDNGHPLSTLNYERYLELIADKSIAYHQARAGDCLPLGDGITLKVLYPERVRTNLTSAYNNNSLLLKLEYGGQNLLLPGFGECGAVRFGPHRPGADRPVA